MKASIRALAAIAAGAVMVWLLGTAVPGLATPPAEPGGHARNQPNGHAQTNGNANGRATTQSTGHGANQSGPYDPNGVGLPSGNGNNDHNNGNRPCAGCVGKADAKNPPGQLPGGSDHNRGYECDANQGVGKTNPAHSGCGPSSTVVPPGGGPHGGGPPGGGPPGGGVSGGESSGGGGPSKRPHVAGKETPKPRASTPERPGRPAFVPVPPTKHVRSVSSPFRSGRLPFTGSSELIGLFLFGTIALAGGFGARWVLRRLPQS